jgi:hypothetical protein
MAKQAKPAAERVFLCPQNGVEEKINQIVTEIKNNR